MKSLKHRVIGAGFRALRASRVDRVLGPWRGRGAILAFHHVRHWRGDAFAPNRLLEITPDFLDTVLTTVVEAGYTIVPMDEILPRLRETRSAPFVALTFDDGYRNLATHALPVLERHRAAFTVYATTGFLDRTAALWWVDLETAIRRRERLSVRVRGGLHTIMARTAAEKAVAFDTIVRLVQAETEPEFVASIGSLTEQAGVVSHETVAALCLDWAELQALAAHPLATVGCHTRTHPRLARLPALAARQQLVQSRDDLMAHLGKPVDHLCYPYGGPSAAAEREYAMARDLGFNTAVTTRPGVLFAHDARCPTALPRLSVNGLWQSRAAFEVLLSGTATGLWTFARRAGFPASFRPDKRDHPGQAAPST